MSSDLQDDLFRALVRAEKAEKRAEQAEKGREAWHEKWAAADALAKKRGGEVRRLRKQLRAKEG